MAATRVLPRLQKRAGQVPQRRPRDDFAIIQLELPRPDLSVELAVLEHLKADWQSVYYVENALFNTLFGLAFWEQIFAPLPGAFVNPYQAAPLDMYQQDFSTRRQPLIDTRLRELESCDLGTELLDCYRRYCGYQNRWVHWGIVTEELLSEALDRIEPAHLLMIWRRQLFDPGENRNGFPDLVAFGHRHSAEPPYCLIEVKGPGDQLQDNQKRWLRCFAEADIPARVARVAWSDD